MNTNFERIRQIFLTIVEQPSAQWEALLDETSGGDPELRQQVALLLKTHAEGEGILDRNEGGRGPTGVYESLSGRPGGRSAPTSCFSKSAKAAITVPVQGNTKKENETCFLHLWEAGSAFLPDARGSTISW
jgi:hypothetical protein